MIENQWAQRYRPHRASDCILPLGARNLAKGIVKHGSMLNMTLAGSPGVGKTTLALALAEELNYEVMFLHGSGIDRGVDTVKGKLERFTTTMSLEGQKKVVVIDEADNMTRDAQLALRSVIEAVSENCCFVLTTNYPHRIDDAILSRCPVMPITASASETAWMQGSMIRRCQQILDTEGVKYDPQALLIIVQQHYPDFRNTINELQAMALKGDISAQAVRARTTDSFKGLVALLKAKDFRGVVTWICESALEPHVLFTLFTATPDLWASDTMWAQAYIIAADAQDKASRVADQHINTVNFCIDIMKKCQFR